LTIENLRNDMCSARCSKRINLTIQLSKIELRSCWSTMLSRTRTLTRTAPAAGIWWR